MAKVAGKANSALRTAYGKDFGGVMHGQTSAGTTSERGPMSNSRATTPRQSLEGGKKGKKVQPK